MQCAPPDSTKYDPAMVFANVNSKTVVKTLRDGDEVIASGPVVEVDGHDMVPIKPEGAVDLDHFIKKESVGTGTIMTCVPPFNDEDRMAEVFESLLSRKVIRMIKEGEQVEVNGPLKK